METHSGLTGIAKIMAGGAAALLLLTACGSGGGAVAIGAATQATYPTATDAQIAEVATKAMNPELDVAKLAPEIRTAFASAATPLTAEQQAVWDRCISEPICETGQGSKTVALIEDQQQAYYSISAGEFIAEAIQSGQVAKIIHSSTNADVSQYLASFRQAIAQGVDLIVTEGAALGAQAAPVFAQAKAAGIPVVNAATVLPDGVAKMLGVEMLAEPCDMWEQAVPMLDAHLKEKGIANPKFALFSGPAGNTYAAAWQGCATDKVKELGWTQVYTGHDVWTPQGQAQAASALLASNSNPDVILTDIAPTQFLSAYISAGKSLPLVMIGGGIDVNAVKAYLDAKDQGVNPDVWATSSQVWMKRAALVAGLELANGGTTSANPIKYPLGAVSFDRVAESIDLTVDSNAVAGNLLSAMQTNEAMKN